MLGDAPNGRGVVVVFVTGGWDDFLNRSRKADSLFFGAGLRWSDDDIKYLLGSIPRR